MNGSLSSNVTSKMLLITVMIKIDYLLKISIGLFLLTAFVLVNLISAKYKWATIYYCSSAFFDCSKSTTSEQKSQQQWARSLSLLLLYRRMNEWNRLDDSKIRPEYFAVSHWSHRFGVRRIIVVLVDTSPYHYYCVTYVCACEFLLQCALYYCHYHRAIAAITYVFSLYN